MQWKGIHGLAWASAWPPAGGLCWVRGQEAVRPGWGSRRPERRASGLLVGGTGSPWESQWAGGDRPLSEGAQAGCEGGCVDPSRHRVQS